MTVKELIDRAEVVTYALGNKGLHYFFVFDGIDIVRHNDLVDNADLSYWAKQGEYYKSVLFCDGKLIYRPAMIR